MNLSKAIRVPTARPLTPARDESPPTLAVLQPATVTGLPVGPVLLRDMMEAKEPTVTLASARSAAF